MQYPFVIQHHEENKRIGSSREANGCKCVNGYKKICKQFIIPLSTVRAIIKKIKRYGTVENLMVRGSNCILPPRILRRMVGEATKSPRITVKELQALVAS